MGIPWGFSWQCVPWDVHETSEKDEDCTRPRIEGAFSHVSIHTPVFESQANRNIPPVKPATRISTRHILKAFTAASCLQTRDFDHFQFCQSRGEIRGAFNFNLYHAR